MATGDLLSVLESRGNEGLRDVVVFAKVITAVETPEYMSRVKLLSGFFAIAEVYAFRCTGTDYFSSWFSNSGVYFSKGTILFVLDDPSMIGKSVRILGSSERGVTIKQQKRGLKSRNDGITALVWRKSGSDWAVAPNLVRPLHSREVKGTALEDFVVSAVADEINLNGRPETVDSYMEFSGCQDYRAIDVSAIEPEFSFVAGERIDVTKIDMKLVYSLDKPIIRAPLSDDFKSEIDTLNGHRKTYSNSLKAEVKGMYDALKKSSGGDVKVEDLSSTIIKRFLRTTCANLNAVIHPQAKTRGKAFLERFVDGAVTFVPIEKNNSSEDDTASKIPANKRKEAHDLVKSAILLEPSILDGSGYITDDTAREYFEMLPAFQDKNIIAMYIVSSLTGIPYDAMYTNLKQCYLYFGFDPEMWLTMLIYFPYILGMVGSGFKVVDCDALHLSFGAFYNKKKLYNNESGTLRSDLLLLETMRSMTDKDTLIPKAAIRQEKGYSLRDSKKFQQNGLPLLRDCALALYSFFEESNIQPSRAVVERYIATVPFSEDRVSRLYEHGLLDTIDDSLILFSDMYKEYTVYNKLYIKGQDSTSIKDDNISETISKYEEKVGFPLEKLQRDAISLVKRKAAVLSGCAGSGKTTTCECLKMAVEDFTEYQIVYCAPTGKACRRLAEVVGGTVKTIHSQFGVGLGSEPYLAPLLDKPIGDKTAYFLDEMAMCNLDLLYEVVRHMTDKDYIYFMGDVKQLEPIGKGYPFKALMSILPCVELGVSKRAAEGSKINYNCSVINFASDKVMFDLVYDDSTFVKEPCSDVAIQQKTLSMFRKLMDGGYGKAYPEADIQVITGYQTDKKLWSTTNLNPHLQNMLRADDDLLFNHVERKFFKNDRVIHVRSNSYSMPRYRLKDGVFYEQVTFGAVNGEMGKLIGVVQGSACTIEAFDADAFKEYLTKMDDDDQKKDAYKELLEKREGYDIRDDSIFLDERYYFAVVKTYDVDLGEDVYLLYRGRVAPRMDAFGLVLEGSDLGFLELAYALTTHKMQGSQSKAVIFLIGGAGSPEFINRNMINTAITRSQEFVGLIGDIEGPTSSLSRGRKIASTGENKGVLTILTDTPKG